jgi:hypothetical protein
LSKHRHERRDLQMVIARLQLFQQHYPSAWVEEQEALLAQAQEHLHVLHLRLNGLIEQREQLRGDELKLQRRHEDYIQKQSHFATDQLQIEIVEAQYPQPESAIEAQITKLQLDIHQHLIDREAHQAAATQAVGRAKTETEALRDVVYRLKLVNEQIQEVRYLEDAVTPIAGNRERLRRAYDLLFKSYTERTSDNALSGRLERVREDIEKEQSAYVKKRGSLDDQAIVAILASVHDLEAVEKHNQQAIIQCTESQIAHEQHTERYNRVQTELHTLEQQHLSEHINEQDSRLMPDDDGYNAEERFQTTLQLHRDSEKRATELEEQARQSANVAENGRLRLDVVRSNLHQHGSFVTSVQQLLSSAAIAGDTGKLAQTPEEADTTATLDALRNDVQEAQTTGMQLDQNRTTIMNGIKSWLNETQFAVLLTPLVLELRGLPDTAYEQRCVRLVEQLTLRTQELENTLASIQPHQEQIVNETLSVARHAITMLKSLTRRSRLPPSLPRFAGHSFLRINLQEIADPAEQRAVIARLIDTIVQSRYTTNDVQLVQQAVAKLIEKQQVEMLFPDPDTRQPYRTIPEIARQSAGQRLTSAVLLYCTLAQLRAHESGRLMGTTTLLLDNPIGSASRPEFLKLQREVAQAMRVQLVYTTGVDDFEAIRMLPNIERLKNNRVDRQTGDHLIERDDAKMLTSVHIKLPSNSE